jgi:hypothetical protein
MFMIDYATPEKAEGTVKEVYSMFPEGVAVPDPMQLFSASPRYLNREAAVIKDFMGDEAYDPGFLAALRYIGASTFCFDACTVFNKDYLLRMGLTEDDIDTLATVPSRSFEDKEAALAAFVAKAMTNPDGVTRADIDAVRARGWTDQQIFECTVYAARMATIGLAFRTFAEK